MSKKPDLSLSIAGMHWCNPLTTASGTTLPHEAPARRETAGVLVLEIPAALPNVLLGLRITSTQVVIGAVVGEMIGANAGLGYLLTLGNETYDSTLVLTAVLVLSLIGVIFYQAVVLLEKRLLFWHESQNDQPIG